MRDDEYVVCPHCNEEHGDAWEWCASEIPQVIRCQSCKQPFSARAEYSVQYVTTTKLPETTTPRPETEGET